MRRKMKNREMIDKSVELIETAHDQVKRHEKRDDQQQRTSVKLNNWTHTHTHTYLKYIHRRTMSTRQVLSRANKSLMNGNGIADYDDIIHTQK